VPELELSIEQALVEDVLLPVERHCCCVQYSFVCGYQISDYQWTVHTIQRTLHLFIDGNLVCTSMVELLWCIHNRHTRPCYSGT
jgi:hypothetical protein